MTDTTNPVVLAASIAATEAVEDVAKQQTNALSPAAVDAAKVEILDAVRHAIATTPEVQHVANTEPFWRKRTTWASLAGIATILTGTVDYVLDWTKDGSEVNLVVIAFGLWSAYASYRAGRATTPLGVDSTTPRGRLPVDYREKPMR